MSTNIFFEHILSHIVIQTIILNCTCILYYKKQPSPRICERGNADETPL